MRSIILGVSSCFLHNRVLSEAWTSKTLTASVNAAAASIQYSSSFSTYTCNRVFSHSIRQLQQSCIGNDSSMMAMMLQQTRGRADKTRQAAAKRFIVTGKGKLKCGHPGKRHNTGAKKQGQMRKLSKLSILTGTNEKNMKRLFRIKF